jgi:8-oxo-dGTP pyrophosphatase MutT (NUDIX family)
MTVPLERRAARVLLVDPSGRILLQNCCDPADPSQRWWVTTGGGVDEGESPEQAAVRELVEETGLRVAPSELGAVVHRRTSDFTIGGQAYLQREDFFLVHTDAFDAAPTVHSDFELMTVLGTRWWSREELRMTGERVYPQELAEVLDRLGA